jgi:hypothetical protein
MMFFNHDVFIIPGRKSNFVADPDELKIPYRLLLKLFDKTDFRELLQVATVYGVKGE